MFSFWSQVSQTSTSATISFVSSVEMQQYPARGLVFIAIGTDFGKFSTFLRSFCNMVKGALICTGVMGEWFGTGTVVGIDGNDEGPGSWPGTGWEFDVVSVEVDKRGLVAK
jgi:hypothetical protein